MLTIRLLKETLKIIAYLRLHKVNFTGRLKLVIHNELLIIAQEFKYKQDKTPF